MVFRFWGCESFELRGLPRFCIEADDWLAANVHRSPELASQTSRREVHRTFGTSIFAGVFAVGICDLITRARSVKASGML